MLQKSGIFSAVFIASQLFCIVQGSWSDAVTNIWQICDKTQPLQVEAMGADGCSVFELSEPKVPRGYAKLENVGYYKFHYEAKHWNEARKICMEQDAHLAIIDSKEEQKALANLLNREYANISDFAYTKDMIWLGVHDMFEEGQWEKVFGDGMIFDAWNSEEPNNGGGHGSTQHCGVLERKGKGMDDYQCYKRLAFICEAPNTCL